jgi:NitT/TauT family transport system substrate-binding protein
MRVRARYVLPAVALVAAAVAATVGASVFSGGGDGLTTNRVTLQLGWVTEARFAGYYAALARGYYGQAGLDVEIRPGGPAIVPELVVLADRAEFGIDWLPSLLMQRDTHKNLVNIGQVFARSGTTEVTFRSSGINAFRKMRGRKFGVWKSGNELEQKAALVKYGLDPRKDVKLVQQDFTMDSFLEHAVDASSAMTYDELAQVLEAKNPKTGKLYTLADLNVFKYQQLGTGMLQDGIFVRGDWLAKRANRATAVKFLEASFRGWAYCRDHLRACVNIVLAFAPELSRRHELWQMNEINALIWPSRNGIGLMDPVSFRRTARIARQFKVIDKPATKTSYRTDLAAAALARLQRQGVDVHGRRWRRAVVKLTPGGK